MARDFQDWRNENDGQGLTALEIVETIADSSDGSDSDTLDGHEGTYYLSRANHTGTQSASTISDLIEVIQDMIASFLVAGAGVSFTYDDATGQLTVTASGGAATDHGTLTGLGDDDHTQYHNDTRGDARYYTQSQVDTALTTKQASDPDLTAIAALTPSNDDVIQRKSGAWANRTIAQFKTDLILVKGDVGLENVTNDAQIPLTQKGANSGVAELDSGGLVPSSQLPSYVDDVIEAANFAALPGTGATGKIYVTIDDNKTYRWSGSAYVEISSSLALGSNSATAHRGDHGVSAYTHSQLTSGNPHNVTKTDVGLSNVSNTAQVTAVTASNGLASSGGTTPNITPTNNLRTRTINFIIDGGGAVIATGVKGDVVVDFDCTIQSVILLADQSGSIVVDIWKDTYFNFPPVAGDSITSSAKPTLSTATKSQDSTLAGWTTGITAGQILRFNVDSAATVQRVTVALKVLVT